MDDLGLADDTIVVFLGDHGWQLGEHAEWAKYTNFEVSLKSKVKHFFAYRLYTFLLSLSPVTLGLQVARLEKNSLSLIK